MKILVVEDEIDLNSVITRHLKKNGYSVDSVYNGEEAMGFTAVAHYDLIVLDLMMPVMGGLKVSHRKASDPCADTNSKGRCGRRCKGA
ncbi:response regulator [Campylobacter concisus]|uniref:response regulator n=1 Tax=Campylobacter concisus TaxID=199 RepID=UPI0021565C73|nr:response regulator [Campylobacter concisus]